jgi:hypothetical protein
MTNSLEPSASFAASSSTDSTGGRSGWRWRFEDASGGEVDAATVGTADGVNGFPSQSDAESWIGEVWRDLLDDGVDQVTLFEADREVYGPMSLHPSA